MLLNFLYLGNKKDQKLLDFNSLLTKKQSKMIKLPLIVVFFQKKPKNQETSLMNNGASFYKNKY